MAKCVRALYSRLLDAIAIDTSVPTSLALDKTPDEEI